jgi:hypothetical protein
MGLRGRGLGGQRRGPGRPARAWPYADGCDGCRGRGGGNDTEPWELYEPHHRATSAVSTHGRCDGRELWGRRAARAPRGDRATARAGGCGASRGAHPSAISSPTHGHTCTATPRLSSRLLHRHMGSSPIQTPDRYGMRPAYPVCTTSNSSNCGVGGSDCFRRLAALARYTTKESWDVSGMSVPWGDAKRVA